MFLEKTAIDIVYKKKSRLRINSKDKLPITPDFELEEEQLVLDEVKNRKQYKYLSICCTDMLYQTVKFYPSCTHSKIKTNIVVVLNIHCFDKIRNILKFGGKILMR